MQRILLTIIGVCAGALIIIAAVVFPSAGQDGTPQNSLYQTGDSSGERAQGKSVFKRDPLVGAPTIIEGTDPYLDLDPAPVAQPPSDGYTRPPVLVQPALKTPPPPVFNVKPQPSLSLLDAPFVSESDLAIGAGGFSDLVSYADFFASNVKNIAFDTKQFQSLLKDNNGIALLPADLIDRAISDGDFSSILPSLIVFKNFLPAKVAYLKTIKVAPAAKDISIYMVRADLLTLELIDRAFEVKQGKMDIKSFESYYARYNNTIAQYRSLLRKDFGLTFSPNLSFIKEFLARIGIAPERALAVAIVPFGGLITATQECSCLGGYTITLTPGYNATVPGTYIFFVSYPFASSPLLFLNKLPFSGSWILGNYSVTPGPCLSAAACVPDGVFIGTVVMAGTS